MLDSDYNIKTEFYGEKMDQDRIKKNGEEDRGIARLVQKGQGETFGVLIERYEDKLKRYGKKFLGSRHDIEDIVQQVFIKAYKNIQSFDCDKKFSPWIYRIAHNEFVNEVKRKKNSPLRFFDPDTIFPHLLSKSEEMSDKIKREELRKELGRNLKKLDLKYREPVVLYYFEGLSYKEIADVLKIPVATVGTRLRRAKQTLKDNSKNLKDFHEK